MQQEALQSKNLRILLVEDNPADAELLQRMLKREGFQIEWTTLDSWHDFAEALSQAPPFDAILCDNSLPGFSGTTALELVRKLQPQTPFIFVSGTLSEEIAIEALTHGATDYVLKRHLTKLPPALNRAVKYQREQRRLKEAETKLRQSEESHKTLLNNLRDIIFALARDGTITYLNHAFQTITGWAVEEWIGKSFVELVHTDDKPKVDEYSQATLTGKQTEPFELRLRTATGEYIVGEVAVMPIWKSGEVMGAEGVARDVTERRKALEQIHLLSDALRSVKDAIVIADLNDDILYINEAFERMYGYTADEIIGKPSSMFRAPRVAPEIAEAIFRETREHGNWEGEVFNIRKDGTIFPIWLSTSVVHDPEGNAIALIGAARDITERKEIEERLREQAALLDISPHAVIVRDLEDHILLWNKSAEKLYGWREQDAIGKNVQELIYTKGYEEFSSAKKTLLERGEWSGELEQITQNGRSILVASRWLLIRDENNNPKSVLVLNEDITEKKKLESQFLRSQRLEGIGTLASGIAHDLNNVLGPILLMVQSLRVKLPRTDDQKMLDRLENITKRGANIVKQVLTFARGVEGERTILHPKLLIKDIEDVITQTFPKLIHIDSHCESDISTISGDSTQIHQVLLNLCVNARDAMPAGGTLTIQAYNAVVDDSYVQTRSDAVPGRYVVIAVKDTGTGIPREIVHKIFEPFFTTKEVGKGTGLGLSTLLGITKSHKGFVEVESEMSKGTEFKIYFPATGAGKASEHQYVDLDALRGHGELILFVEDEEMLLDVSKKTLETYGYRVLAAKDGVEALSLFTKHRQDISVIVTDIAMPHMDGPATIRAIRAMNPQARVIAVSGLTSLPELENQGVIVQEFIAKPFTTETLLETVHTVLQSA